MPIYGYHCDACGHEFEALQKLSDALLVKCPSCGQEKLRKLLSAAGFQLKGSGWYQTDFRSNGSKPADKPAAAGSDAKAGDGKTEGSAEGKSAPATDSASAGKADTKSDAGSAGKAETKAGPASTAKAESKSPSPPGSAG